MDDSEARPHELSSPAGEIYSNFYLEKIGGASDKRVEVSLIFEPEEDFPALYVIRDNP